MYKVLTVIFSLVLAMSLNAQTVLTGDITTNTTLTANNTYLLSGYVRVTSGATLTIEPGTIIYGENSTQGTLIIKPGGKLIANGTPAKPIVFTSEFAKAGSSRFPSYGDWGGIILLGNAPINVPGGTTSIEGPGDSYGGNNPDDNSGILRFVRIEYPGIAFSLNNEINGLTCGGVGRGTTLEYIQVSFSGDDSFEFFGGNVNAKYLIAHRGWDDDFDSDFGFSGKLQFLLAVRDPQVADQSGSNGFESDNDGTGSNNTPITSPTWYNVTLVGPKATSGSTFNPNFKRGMHLKRNSQNKIYNAIALGYPTGILFESAGTINGLVNSTGTVTSVILSGATKAVDTIKSNGTFNPDAYFASKGGRVFADNAEVKLANPFNLANPKPMPLSDSPVWSGGATPPADGFFDPTATYVGAFGSRDWTAGWSNWNPYGYGDNLTVLEGDITTNVTLDSKKVYLLRGFVRVQSGASITIPKGTTLYGENSTQGSLIIKPGGKIFAEGSADSAIVFTSEFTRPNSSRPPTYGDWGGIILLGNAPINVPGGTTSIEGPGDTFGGNNADDNSGVMRYVRIEFPGIAFSQNNEINGLTLGGVGRGTVLDYIQVSYSGDDSFEFFGGNVNAKHLIAYRGWDDDFDTDFGFSGKLQYLVSFRDPQVADQSGSNGFESDNDGTGSGNTPITSPEWFNVTLVGPISGVGAQYNSNYKRGMHLRRNSQNKVNNTVILGWPTALLLDGTGTINGAALGTNYMKNSVLAQNTKNLDTTKSNGTFDPTGWFLNQMNGLILATAAEGQMQDPFNLLNPNATLKATSPLLTGGVTPPNDGFFDVSATFRGAFGSTDWSAGWANFNPASITGVKEEKIFSEANPVNFELLQNYPNPFNPSTKIRFALPEAGNVKLTIYNILGQQIAELVNDFRNVGTYEVDWNAAGLSSGMYIYRLESGSINITKKMSLLK